MGRVKGLVIGKFVRENIKDRAILAKWPNRILEKADPGLRYQGKT